MATLAEKTLSRLRTCRYAGLQVAPDLLDDVIFVFESVTRAQRLREERDAMIRRAALLYPDARPWELAALLSDEAKRLHRVRAPRQQPASHDVPPASVRACLQAAQFFHPLPASHRQFYRVLTGTATTDTPPAGDVS